MTEQKGQIRKNIDKRLDERFCNAQEGDLRVWHIPQVPGKAFKFPVKTPVEGKALQSALAEYDLFQFGHNIKPDFSSAQGMEVFSDGDWEELDEAD